MAARLEQGTPAGVLHIGIAGARTLEPLSLVIGSESIYEDARGPLVSARVEPDAALLAAVRAALPEAHVLPIGTSAHVGGTSACELAGVPAVELRAISNAVDEADRGKWRFEEAFELLGAALDRLDVV